MQVELAEERIFRLADRFSLEHAEGRAWAKRLEAFGALARVTGLFSQPKDDDFTVIYRERRLQPFWRIAVSTATTAGSAASRSQVSLVRNAASPL